MSHGDNVLAFTHFHPFHRWGMWAKKVTFPGPQGKSVPKTGPWFEHSLLSEVMFGPLKQAAALVSWQHFYKLVSSLSKKGL